MLCFSGFELYPRWVPLQALSFNAEKYRFSVRSKSPLTKSLLVQQIISNCASVSISSFF